MLITVFGRWTFCTAASAFSRLGDRLRFVDCARDGGPSVTAVRAALDTAAESGERVRAVVIMHYAGFVTSEAWSVAELCRARSIPVVEDAAHAFGADGAGLIGDLSVFSFHQTKVSR